MKLRPIRNHIIFQFVDDLDSKGQFVTKTASGIVIPGHHSSSANDARWGRVVSVGPECDPILSTPGCEILIAPLRWTLGTPFEGEKLWKTDDKEVLAFRLPEDKQ